MKLLNIPENPRSLIYNPAKVSTKENSMIL